MADTKGFSLDCDMLDILINEGPRHLILSWPELLEQADQLDELQELLQDMDALERLQRRTSQLVNSLMREIDAAMNEPAA